MPTVYDTGSGAIRSRINASGAALGLFRAGDRNRIIREALVFAGRKWLAGFLPDRFTQYVTRAPFGYPARPSGLAVTKLRMTKTGPLFDLWQRIKLKEFRGWDPWGPFPIPRQLEQDFLARNRSRYLYTVGPKKGQVHWRILFHDIRSWAKKRTREYAANLAADGVILPLVQTGTLRDEYASQARATATATASKARLTITIPRGNRQNKWVVKLLGMLPAWEFQAIVRWFDQALQQGLQFAIARRFAASPDGRSVGAGKPRAVGAGAQRSVGSTAA